MQIEKCILMIPISYSAIILSLMAFQLNAKKNQRQTIPPHDYIIMVTIESVLKNGV